MQLIPTFISGLFIIEPKVFSDNRGYFFESFKQSFFEQNNINFIPVQDNESLSLAKNTLRGLHMQLPPKEQAKLIRVISGKILDVAVDLRKNSPTFKQHFAIELSAENKKQLFIPRGFAHGFLSLEENTQVSYKVDNYYSKEHDVSIKWDDTELNINWQTSSPILSEKDLKAYNLNHYF